MKAIRTSELAKSATAVTMQQRPPIDEPKTLAEFATVLAWGLIALLLAWGLYESVQLLTGHVPGL